MATMETLRESSSSLAGLTDYTRDKARVQRHERFVKKVRLCPKASAEDRGESRAPMTLQEYRDRISQGMDDDEEVTFLLRIDRKRRRDGSAHSLSRSKYNIEHDSEGKFNIQEKRKNSPARAISGRSKILVRTPSQEKLGTSTEEISLYGPSLTPRKGRRPNSLLSQQMEDVPELSEAEQSQSSMSEASLDSSDILAAKQSAMNRNATTGTGRLKNQSTGMRNSLRGKSSSHLHPSTPCHSIGENEIEEKPGAPRMMNLYDAATGTFGRAIPVRSPSDSDESFSSFAQKYSRFAQQSSSSEPKPQSSPQSSDSAMDFNESFSSFATFAEDEDWEKGVDGNSFSSLMEHQGDLRGLLEGGRDDDEENSEDELSLGDQSPDSVIVDLTSVSTSVNSQSPRSASRTTVSRERRSYFEVPLAGEAKEKKSRTEERRSRRDTGDDGSIGSALSRHSTRSGGSWLSKHSTRSTGSRFTRLESYLKKNSRERTERTSRNSKEKQDDRSAVSALSEEIQKLANLADDRDEDMKHPFSSDAQHDESRSPGGSIKLNPFLAADRNKNVPVKHEFASPKKFNKVWRPTQKTPEEDSPIKSPTLKDPPRKIPSVKRQTSSVAQSVAAQSSPPRKDPPREGSPAKQGNSSAVESVNAHSTTPSESPSPAKSPAPSPGKLCLDRLSKFAKDTRGLPDVVRTGVRASKSEHSSVNRQSSHHSPRRAKSSEGRLVDLIDLPAVPSLSSPIKKTKESVQPAVVGLKHIGSEPHESSTKTNESDSAEISRPEDRKAKETTVSKVSEFTKKFQQPPCPGRKGINVFNPSATSTGPKERAYPRFVGDTSPNSRSHSRKAALEHNSSSHQPKGVSQHHSSSSPAVEHATRESIGGCSKVDTKSAETNEELPSKASKVRSYLQKFKEISPSQSTNDLMRMSSYRNKWTTEKVQSTRTIQSLPPSSAATEQDVASSSNQLDSKKGLEKDKDFASNAGATTSSKPSRGCIDLYLAKHKSDTEDDVFNEPVPSPWRPSTQSSRVRRRPSMGRSETSSRASSKASAASKNAHTPRGAVASHLSMFQPHRQVSVSSMQSQLHSPKRSPTRPQVSMASPEPSPDSQAKQSLVEQRRRMFQGSKGTEMSTKSTQSWRKPESPSQPSRPANVKQFSMLSLPHLSPVKKGGSEDKETIELPSANDISNRLSKWKAKQVVTGV